MADYISTLTGTQMDQALLDMAEHNSEAYAVGERNGIAVASDDVTYHNNARYYAQIASSQIVGDASSAVRWDTDQSEVLTDAQKAQARENINAASDSDVVKITAQTLTSAEQAQARANIAAGGSNPNLLDNPFFTVNQRNVSGTITDGYIADRWSITYGSGGVTASRTDASVTVQSTSGRSHGDIVQRFEKELFDFLVGRTVTASVMRSDGSVISKSFTFQSSANSISLGTDLDGNVIAVRVYQTSTYQDVQFWKWNTAGTFRAVKLELGSYSTLANDAPPDYEEELRKCMYYFQRIQQKNSYTLCVGFGEAMNSTTNIRITIPTAVPMRHKASAMSAVPTGTGTMYIIGNGQSLPVTAVAGLGVTGNAVVVNVTVSTAGAYNHIYGLRFTNNSTYIDLSADL